MNREEQDIVTIRDSIFKLALKSPSLEVMHWYISLDNCFENSYFHEDEISNMVWRCQVLYMLGQPVTKLAWAIDEATKKRGFNLNEYVPNMEVRNVET